MNLETFHPGEFRQQFQYRSFSPVPINASWQWSDVQVNSWKRTARITTMRLWPFERAEICSIGFGSS